MKADEAQHGSTAMEAGGRELPEFVKMLMRYSAKVMTNTAAYI